MSNTKTTSDQQTNELGQNYFPKDGIDPAKKDAAWGLLWSKAAYNNFLGLSPRGTFYNAIAKYQENRLYAIGDVPITKFKKTFGLEEQEQDTWLNIDWTPPNAIGTIRDIAISRMMQQEYSIVATPIDPMAKSELDKIYAEMSTDIMMRQQLQQQGSSLAQHPRLQPDPGSPVDMEEFKMRVEYGEQFNRSKDSEQAIQLAMYNNNEKQFRRKIFEDLFDCGPAATYEWLDEQGKPRIRNVNVEAAITGYTQYPDFRDIRYAGEIIDVDIATLATLTNPDGTPTFTDDDMEKLASDVAGKLNNPATFVTGSSYYYRGYDSFKVKVLQLRWKSYNDYYYNQWKDQVGNTRFESKKYSTAEKSSRKYKSKRVEVVYTNNWIIGTNYSYGFKLAEDMPRSADPSKKASTSLGYQFYAWNFYDMRCTSMVDRLKPLIDQYLTDWFRLQNLKNRLIPAGHWIDLDALENVALSAGGNKMSPLEILDMFYATGILVGRSKDPMGNNVNYKPVIPLQNSMFQDIVAIFQQMQATLQQMKQSVGLNDVTDSTTPPDKMLVPGYENANAGTNNALYPMQFAEKFLYQKGCEAMLIRTQQALKKGSVEGFATSLNSNALKFLSISKEIGVRPFGIMLEEKSTDDQKMLLAQLMQEDIAKGNLDSSDAIYIMNTYNIKQAQQILAYRAKKNREAQAQQQQAVTQQTIQGQQESAQQTAQLKEQMIQMQENMKTQREKMIQDYQVFMTQLKTHSQETVAQAKNMTDLAKSEKPAAA